jgi:hypothetical protein
LTRAWLRLRRRAQALGVRPLKLHSTRYTWATLALRAGKSVRWVAEQLGHAGPSLTLPVYAHAMREEEDDLSFVEFAREVGPGRPYAAPALRAIDGGRGQVRETIGGPGGIRTPDPQVRSQSGEAEAPPESPEDPSPSRTEPE